MEKHIKTRGIILRRINLNEADQIITLVTDTEGKVSLLARGSRRLKSKFCSKLEVFYEGHFNYFQGKELGYLNEVDTTCLLNDENLSLRSRSLLFYLTETTLKLLADKQECQEVYQILKQTLEHFDEDCGEAIFYSYLTKILTQLGFMGHWDKCHQTSQKLNLEKTYFFSPSETIVYSSNQPKSNDLRLNTAVIKWINFMQKEDFLILKKVRPSSEEKVEVFFIIKSILGHLFDRSFKSEAFMQSFI